MPAITRKAFAERGFHEAAILTDWPAIVGDDLADCCAAVEFTGDGALVVRAEGPTAARLQHLEPQILERIATYFGFRAVKRLALRQGPVPPRAAPGRAPARPVEAPATLARDLNDVPDDALRAALLRLGARVAGADENG